MGSKEQASPGEKLGELAQILRERFMQRHDIYARQLHDGRYVCMHQPLQSKHLIAHLQGRMTLGAYLLNAESEGRMLVLDADDERQWQALINLARQLREHEATAYLEQSRRGGHLWLFFATPRAGRDLRALGRGLLATVENGADIEIYPKQDSLNGGVGSLVRLPFGVHRRSGQRYGFVDVEGKPLADSMMAQVHLLAQTETVPERLFDLSQYDERKREPTPDFARVERGSGPVSERVKAALSVREFVGEYVELSATGTGRCPFHDDDVASFGVNDEGNYWHCFACQTGGSIIDFWMRYRQCDFKQALRELAGMLLK